MFLYILPVDILLKYVYTEFKESTGLCTEQLKETRSYTIEMVSI